MAKDLVKLVFISAIVFCVLSPTIDVTKAEIVEKDSPKPLLESKTVLATNEIDQAQSRRYGPLIRQPIFSRQVRVPGNFWCDRELWTDSCYNCNSSCQSYDDEDIYYEWGQCTGAWPFRECHCYFECNPR